MVREGGGRGGGCIQWWDNSCGCVRMCLCSCQFNGSGTAIRVSGQSKLHCKHESTPKYSRRLITGWFDNTAAIFTYVCMCVHVCVCICTHMHLFGMLHTLLSISLSLSLFLWRSRSLCTIFNMSMHAYKGG